MGTSKSNNKSKWVFITKDFTTASRTDFIMSNLRDSTTIKDFTMTRRTAFTTIKRKTDFTMTDSTTTSKSNRRTDFTTTQRRDFTTKRLTARKTTNPMSMKRNTNTKARRNKSNAS